MLENPDALNLNRFRPFIYAISGCDCAIFLFDEAGKQLLQDYPGRSPRFDMLLEAVNGNPPEWHSIAAHRQVVALQDVSLMVSVLSLGANQEVFYLVALINKQYSQLDVQLKQALNKVLADICVFVAEDYTKETALHSMAEELAVRYEELNLLYRMDDLETYYANSSEMDALIKLIENCRDYMGVDLVLLNIPGQKIYIQKTVGKNCAVKQDALKNSLQQTLYPFIKQQPEPLVINRDADTDWTDANLDIPCKIIAIPILKMARQATGILLLVNGMEKPDFTNSDRKLAEVLAAEVSKLIQSRRDNITGLLNRRGFQEKLQQAVAQNGSSGQQNYLLHIDLDQFKVINDTSGQQTGDRVLSQVGALITQEMHGEGVLARLGSDEFGFILENCSSDEAFRTAEKIRAAIKQFRFFFNDKLFDVGVSIGMACFGPDTKNVMDVLGSADLACNIAKERGGNRIHVYEATDQETAHHEAQLRWISRINSALENEQFLIYRQPIQGIQGNDRGEEHYEVLLRLQEEDGRIVSPFHFIPAAERYGLMSKLDRWVVSKTLTKMSEILVRQPASSLSCSINLSGQSFCEDGFIEFVIGAIDASDVPASRICFEITETAAVSNLSQAIAFMQALKAIGCSFSLDDFGSGMSSFTYLKNLPVDYLKIDGYFVKSMLENNVDHAMVASIHQVGHVMGLKTIAEFVENDALLAELKTMGIDYAQGYGIGKPEPFL